MAAFSLLRGVCRPDSSDRAPDWPAPTVAKSVANSSVRWGRLRTDGRGLDDGSWLRREAEIYERLGNKEEAARMRLQAEGVRRQYLQEQKERARRERPLGVLIWLVALGWPVIMFLILETVPSWLLIGLLPSIGLIAMYVFGRFMSEE